MATSRFGSAAWWLGTLVSQGGNDVGIMHVVNDDGTGTASPGPSAAQFPAALAANGGLKVEGIVGGVAQPVSGPQTNAEFLAANRCTVTKSSVNSAATSTSLLAANANRKSLAIVNTDANILYVDPSGGTATNACIPIASGGYWAPDGAMPVGAITGIWAADGAGVATVFEGA